METKSSALPKVKGSVSLSFIWKFRLRLYADAHKIWVDPNKLYAEAKRLWAEGDRLWAEAILEAYGNIGLEWKNWNDQYQSYECHLENGEVYGFEEQKA